MPSRRPAARAGRRGPAAAHAQSACEQAQVGQPVTYEPPRRACGGSTSLAAARQQHTCLRYRACRPLRRPSSRIVLFVVGLQQGHTPQLRDYFWTSTRVLARSARLRRFEFPARARGPACRADSPNTPWGRAPLEPAPQARTSRAAHTTWTGGKSTTPPEARGPPTPHVSRIVKPHGGSPSCISP